MEELKLAIIGFGGIARVHNTAYQELMKVNIPVRIVAICDKNANRFTEELDFNQGRNYTPLPEGAKLYTDVDEMLENEEIDAVDICLPLFLHKTFAVKLLKAGKHVFCEKPMASSTYECREMIEAWKESGKVLMIGNVLRFSPVYTFLGDCVRDNRFGTLRELIMNRYSVYPTWGDSAYFNDITKCGGAALDTHIHDVDIAVQILGTPDSVSGIEYNNIPYTQAVNSRLHYGDTTVIANCAWDTTFEIPLEKNYRARFDNASVVYNGETLTVHPNGGEKYNVDPGEHDIFFEELRYFTGLVMGSIMENTVCSPESTYQAVSVIEHIRASSQLGGALVKINK